MKKNSILFVIFLILLCSNSFGQGKAKPPGPTKDNTTKPVEKENKKVENKDTELLPLKIVDDYYDYKDEAVPARIEYYWVDGYRYSYLRPIDLNTYEYLSYYPLTAYFFCVKMDADKISNLSIKNLKSLTFTGVELGSTYRSYAYSLFYIKGFEDYAKEINKSDEFTIAQKKDVYIARLLECFNNYNNEFENRYLKTFMTVIGGTKSETEKKPLKVYGETSFKDILIPEEIVFDKKNYDFDNQNYMIRIPFFNGRNESWDYDETYGVKYHKFQGSDRVNLPIPIDLFKQIIDYGQYYGYYKLTVKPTREITSPYPASNAFVCHLNFYKLEVIIGNAISNLPSNEWWHRIDNEVYRTTIF